MSVSRATKSSHGDKRFKDNEEDTKSFCGSFSGDTFSARQRRGHCSLRQHNISNVAAQLRTQLSTEDPAQTHAEPDVSEAGEKARFNKVFHHLRLIIVMTAGLSVGFVFLLRVNITVAILNMVNQTALYLEEHPNSTMDDFLAEGYSPGGDFDWDNEIQQMIISWYMITYTLPQMPLQKLASKMGARGAVAMSLAICAVSTLILPPLAHLGWEYVILLRLMNGIGAAAVIPMMVSLVESWMPYDEIQLGLSFASLLTALMSASIPLATGYLVGIHWSWAFYVPGALTLVFCVYWLCVVTGRPDDNWLISDEELKVICGCFRKDYCDQESSHNHSMGLDEKAKQEAEKRADVVAVEEVSWIRVLRVPSFYFYIILWSCYCSVSSCFVFVLPTYLRQFLKVPVSQNGVYCGIIQAGLIIGILWPHLFQKLLRKRLGLSETGASKMTHLLITVVSSITWLYVGWFHQYQMILLIINRAFMNANEVIIIGALMSNYAKLGLTGTVLSIVNTIGNISTVFMSTFIGWALDYASQSEECWSWVFTGFSAVIILHGLIFQFTIRVGPIDLSREKTRSSSEERQATKASQEPHVE